MLENSPADATQLPTGCQPESLAKPARRRSHKATQPQLLTCRELDGRTSAAKAFDRLVAVPKVISVAPIAADAAGHSLRSM